MTANKPMGETAQNFIDTGCCLIRKILDKDLCNFLSTQIELDSINLHKKSATQVAGSIELYNTEASQIANNLLLAKIKDFIHLDKLFSTYSFYRKYYKYQQLEKHSDRPECEISLSVCLGMSDKTKPWPIYFENTALDTVFSAVPNIGDGVLYLGMALPHWREKCEQNWVKQAFFHYSPNRELEFDSKNSAEHDPQRDLIKIICENL